MPLAFFAPLFLAGAALVAVPYIIHQIRRPDREPMRFSSLMFIPDVKKEVIERRRLQHLLLMLLRMFLFMLLVLAFSRPYWRLPATADVGAGPGRHLILLDASYSMGTLDWFEQAKSRARDVLSSIGQADRVGVVVFGSSPEIKAPLFSSGDSTAGSRGRAQTAIDGAELTEETTAYLPALQMAQDLLMAGAESAEEIPDRMVLHLISDFQSAGMPEHARGWKLASKIELHSIEVGEPDVPNHSITDLGVRRSANGEVRILGKVKNWSTTDERPVEVKLIIEGEERAADELMVKAKNASQTSFRLPPSKGSKVEGWLEIGPDSLGADNRRYFIWTPPRKKDVLLVADESPGATRPARLFLESAVPSGEDIPWALQATTQRELPTAIRRGGSLPDLIIAADLNEILPETTQTLLDYVRGGGQLLLTLGPGLDSQTLNSTILPELGLGVDGLRHEQTREYIFDTLGWVDFDHPVFSPFLGSRFNDFSQIRFYNYHRLNDPEAQARVISRFMGDGEDSETMAPAIVEVKLGEGRVIVWPFGMDLEWSNLPKNVKFLPILHETMAYLTGVDEVRRSWVVGESYGNLPKPSTTVEHWVVQKPLDQEVRLTDEQLAEQEGDLLERAGFIRWKAELGEDWEQIDAVNVDPAEADPRRVGVQEFELRLTSTPVLETDLGLDEIERQGLPAGFIVKGEYWQVILGLLLLFLIVEGWYATRLAR